MHDQDDDIADALERLHAAGWSIGDTAFFDVERVSIVHVVIGSNGEDQIRAEGETTAEAWRRATRPGRGGRDASEGDEAGGGCDDQVHHAR